MACPSCFGLIFQGAKFCSHCGAKVEQPAVVAAGKELCPRCRVDMNAVVLGTTNLRECPRCEGLWMDRIYSPLVTLWGFLGQVLSADHSCRAAAAISVVLRRFAQ